MEIDVAVRCKKGEEEEEDDDDDDEDDDEGNMIIEVRVKCKVSW